ncbi:MAG: hypothetical protein ACLFV5_04465 [Anaerolineales bacterium]
MAEGTPLFAPVDGRAHFLHDERPLETNLGHYVEIVTEDGDWLVRLAHLRDPQSGERDVKVGELVGHAGRSGVPSAHLHVELLVRQDGAWRCPDSTRLTRPFGLPLETFTEGTIIRKRNCPAEVVVSGPIKADTEVALGETASLSIPLRNEGDKEALLNNIHVLLAAPSGISHTTQAHGPWSLEGGTSLSVGIPFQPSLPGAWAVQELVYMMDDQPHTIEAQGEMEVAPSALRLAQIDVPAQVGVGEEITLTVGIENKGERTFAFDDLVLAGERPDGERWTARAGLPGTLARDKERSFVLHSEVVPQSVGTWQGVYVGYNKEGSTFFFDETNCTFPVKGPEIRTDELRAYVSADVLRVFLQVSNVGTAPAQPDRLEIWGWKPDGERTFSAREEAPAPLPAGGVALFQFDVPLDDAEGAWQLAEAGYWMQGDYYTIPIPRQEIALDEGTESL